MANTQNLIPQAHKLTLEEQSAGGKASVEARRRRKTLKEELEILMAIVAENGKTYQENMTLALMKQSLKGNVKAYETIRDTIGETVTNKIEITETPKIIDDIKDENGKN